MVITMINTVKGTISSNDLGVTYIHDHLFVNPNPLPEYKDYIFDDVDKSIAEAIDFKNNGGSTIIDLTPINYGRNPIALQKISEGANINIGFVTGFHKEEFMPKWIDKMSDKQIFDFLVNEIENGVSSRHLLPVAMKAGTSFKQITKREKRILQIEGKVQRATHIPMITHCDKGTMAIEQVEILRDQGANLKHICLSHVDIPKNIDYIEKICDTGVNISFDHIGRELSTNDRDRIQMLCKLVEDGYVDHICLSGDMGRKSYFLSYKGKPGLRYIITTLKQSLVPLIGNDNFAKMVIDNPKRVLENKESIG